MSDAKEPESKRMECPKCGCEHFEVVWIRHREKQIVRRRACRHCGRQVTTREKIV